MINPQFLDLSTLPSIPLKNKAQLPEIPCIYFAVDSLGIVQYIGRAANVKARWTQHHRYLDLCQLKEVKIVYLNIDNPELLPEVEKALIAWFKPVLNGTNYTVSPTNKKDGGANLTETFPVKMTAKMKEWVKAKGGGVYIRELIEKDMVKDK